MLATFAFSLVAFALLFGAQALVDASAARRSGVPRDTRRRALAAPPSGEPVPIPAEPTKVAPRRTPSR